MTQKMKDSLISSFLTNIDHKGTMRSGTTTGLENSLQYSNTAITKMNPTGAMEVIQSEDGEGSQDSFGDDIDRYEEVDMDNMQPLSGSQNSKMKQKAILTPEQIEEAHKEREQSSNDENYKTLMK